MAEEATDVQSAVVAPPAAPPQEPAAPDSSPEETKQPAEAKDPILEALTEDDKKEPSKSETDKPEEKPKEETTPEAKPKEEETAEADKPKEDDAPQSPKSENRFQKLANENRALKEQVSQLTSQAYQAQSPEDLEQEVNPETGEQYSRAEAKIAAFEQRQELRDYNDRVTEAQLTIGQESQQILESLPIVNPDSPEYKPEIAQAAAQAFEANLIRDPNIPEVDQNGQRTGQGIIVGYHAPPSLIYQPIAQAYEMSKVEGQIQGQKATEQQLSRVDAPSSASPPKPKVDPILAILKSDDY